MAFNLVIKLHPLHSLWWPNGPKHVFTDHSDSYHLGFIPTRAESFSVCCLLVRLCFVFCFLFFFKCSGLLPTQNWMPQCKWNNLDMIWFNGVLHPTQEYFIYMEMSPAIDEVTEILTFAKDNGQGGFFNVPHPKTWSIGF